MSLIAKVNVDFALFATLLLLLSSMAADTARMELTNVSTPVTKAKNCAELVKLLVLVLEMNIQ